MKIIIALIVVPVLILILNSMYPNAVFPASVHAAAIQAGGYLKALNDIFDTHLMLNAVYTIVGFELVVLGWKTFKRYMGWTIGE